MSIAGFVAELEGRQVRLRADGDRLHCTAPEGVLSAELVGRIRERKAEILRYLHGRADRSGPLPLSLAQERLWLHSHFEPADSAYHLPLAVRLDGPLGTAVLAQALAEVVRRHEVLRTTYRSRHGRLCQEIGTAVPALAVVDLTGLPPALMAATARRLTEADARRPFDLATGPVMRTSIVRCGPLAHRLLITRHHIASDGWSFGVLGSELSTLYRAFRDGEPSPLAELPMQYADFARWQRDLVESGALQPKLDRWLARLEGAPTSAGLVAHGAGRADRVPDSAPEPVGTVRRALDRELTNQILGTARAAGATAFTALVAAFGLVVAAASGQREVIIGSPAAGRPRRELEPLIGSFATMLPLRIDAGGDPTFRELLRRVHAVVVAALDLQDVPQERLVDALRPKRSIGGAPLFSVVFTYQNIPPAAVSLPGIGAVAEEPVAVAPKFPLTLTATADAGEHALLAEFDTGRIQHAAVTALVDRFVAFLELASQRPDERCAALIRELAARLPAQPASTVPGGPQTLAAGFIDAVRRTPDAIALSCHGEQISYRTLYQRARRLAARLLAAGMAPERLVGVCVEPSVDLIVAIVASVLGGGAYVPLDPEDPPTRHEAVIDDAGIAMLVTSSAMADRFAWYDGPTLLVDDPRPAPAAGTAPAAAPDQLAYVIYTSGSTGAPKGVMVTNRNVTAMFAAASSLFEFAGSDAWTLAHSAAFDFSVWEMWGALLHGARLVVLPRAVVRDPTELWRTVCAEQVTLLSSTPSAFHTLVPAALDAGAAGAAGTALRAVVFGGERCDPARLRPWLERFGAERPHLINMYGITETTVHVTHCRLGETDTGADSPIGRPLPCMRAQAVDPHGVPVPVGGQGELLVGGIGVARGYLHRPGLTADRFRPDDLDGEPGSRCYTSGDLVRLLPGGGFGYLGRLDHQVKVRGYRIEPGEVEAALAARPDVLAAAVTAQHEAERSYLVGYVVAAPGSQPSGSVLRRFLAERLPAHMVPAIIVSLDRLPLTRNGKLDYAALPPPGQVAATAAGGSPPTTPTELTLAAMWRELLGVESIGVHDNFFELGGDSLLVTRLHARLPAAFGVDLPMRQVYQALDIAALAVAIDKLLADAVDADLLRLVEEVEQLPKEELRRRLS